MKNILGLIAIIIFSGFNTFCDCYEKNSMTVKEMYETHELIIIAEPIENIHANKDLKTVLDSKNKGTEVSMKIKKIIKGDIQTVNIITYQFDNCPMNFNFGESYIVFGNQIKSFQVTKGPKSNYIEDGEQIQLPNSELKNNVLSIYNGENDKAEFWNKQSRSNTIVQTDLCITGKENGKLHKLLLNLK